MDWLEAGSTAAQDLGRVAVRRKKTRGVRGSQKDILKGVAVDG